MPWSKSGGDESVWRNKTHFLGIRAQWKWVTQIIHSNWPPNERNRTRYKPAQQTRINHFAPMSSQKSSSSFYRIYLNEFPSLFPPGRHPIKFRTVKLYCFCEIRTQKQAILTKQTWDSSIEDSCSPTGTEAEPKPNIVISLVIICIPCTEILIFFGPRNTVACIFLLSVEWLCSAHMSGAFPLIRPLTIIPCSFRFRSLARRRIERINMSHWTNLKSPRLIPLHLQITTESDRGRGQKRWNAL